jgi:hypothetical protein
VAFTEIDIKRCEKIVGAFVARRRPAPHLRAKVDLAFRITGQSVEIFEIRPKWDDETRLVEHAIAKATYHRGKRLWKLYWRRADLKWHGYGPAPEVESLEQFVAIVGEDAHGCFFG